MDFYSYGAVFLGVGFHFVCVVHEDGKKKTANYAKALQIIYEEGNAPDTFFKAQGYTQCFWRVTLLHRASYKLCLYQKECEISSSCALALREHV